MRRFFLLGAVLACGTARAESFIPPAVPFAQGQGWSLFSGQTIGAGSHLVEAQVGYPGLSVGFLHGLTNRIDVGATFTFNYSVEGDVQKQLPGIKPQFVLRASLIDQGPFNLGLRFAPGPLFYFPQDSATLAGFAMPLEVAAGFPVGSAIMLNGTVALPLFVAFGVGGGPVLPILFGVGGEYFIDHSLSVNVNVRMGPTVTAATAINGNTRAYFTFEGLLGVAYRI
jgi:hypothetical protein